MKTYLVGGAIRDKKLGLTVKDQDWVVVGETPESMLKKGFIPVGKSFPVFLHPKTKEEHALARTEKKSGKGYHGFIFNTDQSVTLEDDLKRRDLTINAIAKDKNGNLIDPYNGLKDLKEKKLRHVSDAFAEDPLRVLRVARFLARFKFFGFSIAYETLNLMKKITESGELTYLTPERIWQETLLALKTDNPQCYFETLREIGALKILFPEIDQLFGVPQTKKYHPEVDCGIHLMMVLAQAAKLNLSPEARFAALVHDLGKGITPKDILPKHMAHEHHGVPLVLAMCQRLRIPKRFETIGALTCLYHTHCHKAFELKPYTILKLLKDLSADKKPKQFDDFLMACFADSRGRLGFELINYPQIDYLKGALKAIKSISAQTYIKQGLKGKTLGNAIEQAQIKALNEYKKDYSSIKN